jgi:hypothetical protein
MQLKKMLVIFLIKSIIYKYIKQNYLFVCVTLIGFQCVIWLLLAVVMYGDNVMCFVGPYSLIDKELYHYLLHHHL